MRVNYTVRKTLHTRGAPPGFPGREAWGMWGAISGPSTWLGAVVRELQRDAQVLLSQHGDHLLQVVLVLAGHADLVFLDGGLDLQLGVLDHPHDLPCFLDRNPLLQANLLPQHAAAAGLDRAVRQRL